jgi:hypothetical protein
MRYRIAVAEPVEFKPTKFDDCILAATGHPYKSQKGSGRSAVIALAVDGMTLGQLAQEACKIGFTADFAVDCAWKQHTTKDGAWKVKPPEGITMAEVKARKSLRPMTPEQQAAAEAREKAKADAKAAREAAKAEKAAAAEAAKAEAKAAREAAKAAATANGNGATTVDGADAAVAKGKGKGKAKAAAGPTPEAQAEASANV